MTPADWDRIQTLFHEASGLKPDQRQDYLHQQCGSNTALLREVESLLAEVDTADQLFEGAVEEAAADVLASEHGQRIGPYAIHRRLGEGGMGAVYLAVRDDDQYQKQVAIKLVRSELQKKESVARFRAERQILANLDHPGIARLLDGGATASGAPYVVMEYVDGVPIDEYCWSGSRPVRDRLLLFLEVCDAVAYAHRNLW
jgi:serine/threonine protein kinase